MLLMKPHTRGKSCSGAQIFLLRAEMINDKIKDFFLWREVAVTREPKWKLHRHRGETESIHETAKFSDNKKA